MNALASVVLALSLLVIGACALPRVAGASPASDDQGPPPQLIGVPGLRPSRCSLPEPVAGLKRSYPVPRARGFYRAFGDRTLLPESIVVKTGKQPHLDGIDQLLFGAETTITLPSTARLLDGPKPFENLGVPGRPVAEVYHSQIEQDSALRTQTYRLKMTASVWEIAGRQLRGRADSVACLYFHRQRGLVATINDRNRRTQGTVWYETRAFDRLLQGKPMLLIAIASLGSWPTLEPHGPVDLIPRCVTKAQKRTHACHCNALNRTPMPDGAWYVLHRGRCIVEGGLGTATNRPPPPVPPPPKRRGLVNPSKH